MLNARSLFNHKVKNSGLINSGKLNHGFLIKKLIIIIVPLTLIAQGNYQFGPSIRVNDDAPGTHLHGTTQRSIGCHGDTVYLVWEDNRYGNPIYYNHRVFFSKSADAGNTWSPNSIISQDTDNYPCFDAHVSLDAFGSIYVSYCGQDGSSRNSEIYFTKSTDGGNSFSVPLLVNDSAEVLGQVYPACTVDSSGQHVYVVWQDSRNYDASGYDIYFSRSTDGGQSFLPSVRVNDDVDSMDQWFPVIACDETGQYVYVAWMDNRDTLHGWDVYFARSTDYGQTFESNYLISDTTTTGGTTQGYPSIYYKNSVIYAVWRDQYTGYCLFFAKSTDNGMSFGPQVLVADDPEAHGIFPSITADDLGYVYVVWEDFRDYNLYGHDIYFSYSSDGGQSFNTDVRVNDHLGVINAQDNHATICVNETGKVFVAWDSDRNDEPYGYEDIYVARGSYVGIEEHASGFIPGATRLDVYPNPFNQITEIRWQLGAGVDSRQKSIVSIKIYDVSGRLIRFLPINQLTNSQINEIVWDGKDNQDRELPCGVYFIRFIADRVEQTSGYRETRKAILLK